jgi:CIC family chloride channel protein
MASFFAGVASAPIGALLMVTEMTGGYALLPPLMLVSVLAILFARGRSIYEHQVRDRFASPAHLADLTLNVLEELRVGDVFDRGDVATVTPATRFQRVRELVLAAEDATVPVVDDAGRVVGLVTAEQIRQVLDERQLDGFIVAGDIAAPGLTVFEDVDLYRAQELLRASGCPQIPVLSATDGEPDSRPKIVGMIDYRDVMRAYEKELSRRREA